MIHDSIDPINNADNVEWSAPTVLDGTAYPDGLIFVNEDHGDGEIWVNETDGSNPILIGDTAESTSATESTGILDISDFVGYNPGSILLTNNQGSTSSMTVLINPDAQIDDADFDGDGDVDGADFLELQRNLGTGTFQDEGDAENDGDVDAGDLAVWESQFGAIAPLSATTAVPEPTSLCLFLPQFYCVRAVGAQNVF